MTKDLIRIYDLISNIIMLKHPIIMDIRYRYHVVLGRVLYHKTEIRSEWDKGAIVTKIRGYALIEFIKTMLLKKDNRKNLILVLSFEVDRLAKNYQGSKPNVTEI